MGVLLLSLMGCQLIPRSLANKKPLQRQTMQVCGCLFTQNEKRGGEEARMEVGMRNEKVKRKSVESRSLLTLCAVVEHVRCPFVCSKRAFISSSINEKRAHEPETKA